MKTRLLFCLAATAIGCGGTADAPVRPTWMQAGTATAAAASSGSPLERYLPLVDGTLFQYEREVFSDAATASTGLLMATAHRTSPTGGDLRLPSGTRHIEYVPDGVVMVNGAERSYVLKAPLEAGATWTGEHGAQVKVVGVDLPITVAAGSFQGCVRTEEAHYGDRPRKVLTTYCPDVGIVVLEGQSAAGMERASLKHFGPPIDLGPEGVTRTPRDQTGGNE